MLTKLDEALTAPLHPNCMAVAESVIFQTVYCLNHNNSHLLLPNSFDPIASSNSD